MVLGHAGCLFGIFVASNRCFASADGYDSLERCSCKIADTASMADHRLGFAEGGGAEDHAPHFSGTPAEFGAAGFVTPLPSRITSKQSANNVPFTLRADASSNTNASTRVESNFAAQHLLQNTAFRQKALSVLPHHGTVAHSESEMAAAAAATIAARTTSKVRHWQFQTAVGGPAPWEVGDVEAPTEAQQPPQPPSASAPTSTHPVPELRSALKRPHGVQEAVPAAAGGSGLGLGLGLGHEWPHPPHSQHQPLLAGTGRPSRSSRVQWADELVQEAVKGVPSQSLLADEAALDGNQTSEEEDGQDQDEEAGHPVAPAHTHLRMFTGLDQSADHSSYGHSVHHVSHGHRPGTILVEVEDSDEDDGGHTDEHDDGENDEEEDGGADGDHVNHDDYDGSHGHGGHGDHMGTAAHHAHGQDDHGSGGSQGASDTGDGGTEDGQPMLPVLVGVLSKVLPPGRPPPPPPRPQHHAATALPAIAEEPEPGTSPAPAASPSEEEHRGNDDDIQAVAEDSEEAGADRTDMDDVVAQRAVTGVTPSPPQVEDHSMDRSAPHAMGDKPTESSQPSVPWSPPRLGGLLASLRQLNHHVTGAQDGADGVVETRPTGREQADTAPQPVGRRHASRLQHVHELGQSAASTSTTSGVDQDQDSEGQPQNGQGPVQVEGGAGPDAGPQPLDDRQAVHRAAEAASDALASARLMISRLQARVESGHYGELGLSSGFAVALGHTGTETSSDGQAGHSHADQTHHDSREPNRASPALPSQHRSPPSLDQGPMTLASLHRDGRAEAAVHGCYDSAGGNHGRASDGHGVSHAHESVAHGSSLRSSRASMPDRHGPLPVVRLSLATPAPWRGTPSEGGGHSGQEGEQAALDADATSAAAAMARDRQLSTMIRQELLARHAPLPPLFSNSTSKGQATGRASADNELLESSSIDLPFSPPTSGGDAAVPISCSPGLSALRQAVAGLDAIGQLGLQARHAAGYRLDDEGTATGAATAATRPVQVARQLWASGATGLGAAAAGTDSTRPDYTVPRVLALSVTPGTFMR